MKYAYLATLLVLAASCLFGGDGQNAGIPETAGAHDGLEEETATFVETVIREGPRADNRLKNLCYRIASVRDYARRKALFLKLSGDFLAIDFEKVADFPPEEWDYPSADGEPDEERQKLANAHYAICCGFERVIMWMRYAKLPPEECWATYLRIFGMLAAERKRLGTRYLGEAEAAFRAEYFFASAVNAKAYDAETERRVRGLFEKALGRPPRTIKELREVSDSIVKEGTRLKLEDLAHGAERAKLAYEERRRKAPPGTEIPRPGTGEWRKMIMAEKRARQE